MPACSRPGSGRAWPASRALAGVVMQDICLGGVAGERRACHFDSHVEGKAFPCCHTVVLEKTSPSRIERLCNSRLAHGARQAANGGMWMLQPVHGCMQFRYVLDLLGTNTLTHMLHTHTSTQRCDDRQEGQGRSASSGCLDNGLDRVPPRTHTTAATNPLYVSSHVYDRHELCRGRRARFRAEEEGAPRRRHLPRQQLLHQRHVRVRAQSRLPATRARRFALVPLGQRRKIARNVLARCSGRLPNLGLHPCRRLLDRIPQPPVASSRTSAQHLVAHARASSSG